MIILLCNVQQYSPELKLQAKPEQVQEVEAAFDHVQLQARDEIIAMQKEIARLQMESKEETGYLRECQRESASQRRQFEERERLQVLENAKAQAQMVLDRQNRIDEQARLLASEQTKHIDRQHGVLAESQKQVAAMQMEHVRTFKDISMALVQNLGQLATPTDASRNENNDLMKQMAQVEAEKNDLFRKQALEREEALRRELQLKLRDEKKKLEQDLGKKMAENLAVVERSALKEAELTRVQSELAMSKKKMEEESRLKCEERELKIRKERERREMDEVDRQARLERDRQEQGRQWREDCERRDKLERERQQEWQERLERNQKDYFGRRQLQESKENQANVQGDTLLKVMVEQEENFMRALGEREDRLAEATADRDKQLLEKVQNHELAMREAAAANIAAAKTAADNLSGQNKPLEVQLIGLAPLLNAGVQALLGENNSSKPKKGSRSKRRNRDQSSSASSDSSFDSNVDRQHSNEQAAEAKSPPASIYEFKSGRVADDNIDNSVLSQELALLREMKEQLVQKTRAELSSLVERYTDQAQKRLRSRDFSKAKRQIKSQYKVKSAEIQRMMAAVQVSQLFYTSYTNWTWHKL